MTGSELSFRLFVLCAVVMIAGAAVVAYGFWLREASEQKLQWPAVQGVLLRAELAAKDQDQLSRSRIRQQVKPEHPNYRSLRVWDIDASYRYTVGEREFTGSTATSTLISEPAEGGQSAPSERLRDAARRLRPGPVPVHYDPEHPEQSYLVHVPDPMARQAMGFGLKILAVAAVAAAVCLVSTRL